MRIAVGETGSEIPRDGTEAETFVMPGGRRFYRVRWE